MWVGVVNPLQLLDNPTTGCHTSVSYKSVNDATSKKMRDPHTVMQTYTY